MVIILSIILWCSKPFFVNILFIRGGFCNVYYITITINFCKQKYKKINRSQTLNYFLFF